MELLSPAGPELARRWVSALLLVPEHHRHSLVEEVERRVIERFVSATEDSSDTANGI